MVLKHELTACYAAGSLGGTLGRLNESFRRLSRAHCAGSREKPGAGPESRFSEPAKLAHLNQTLRLMADAWRSRTTATPQFGRIDNILEQLKENALTSLGANRSKTVRHSKYILLAQALDNLKANRRSWM